jgi:hypothetical protein
MQMRLRNILEFFCAFIDGFTTKTFTAQQIEGGTGKFNIKWRQGFVTNSAQVFFELIRGA